MVRMSSRAITDSVCCVCVIFIVKINACFRVSLRHPARLSLSLDVTSQPVLPSRAVACGDVLHIVYCVIKSGHCL